jgi:hypothetical protein
MLTLYGSHSKTVMQHLHIRSVWFMEQLHGFPIISYQPEEWKVSHRSILHLYVYPTYQIFKANKEGTDWYKEIYRTGIIQEYDMSVAGGGQKRNICFFRQLP